MKGALGAVGLRGLDDADTQLPSLLGSERFVAGVDVELAPAEQLPQGIDLVEGQVVAGAIDGQTG